jgi:hypothetical protein
VRVVCGAPACGCEAVPAHAVAAGLGMGTEFWVCRPSHVRFRSRRTGNLACEDPQAQDFVFISWAVAVTWACEAAQLTGVPVGHPHSPSAQLRYVLGSSTIERAHHTRCIEHLVHMAAPIKRKLHGTHWELDCEPKMKKQVVDRLKAMHLHSYDDRASQNRQHIAQLT